MRDQDRSLTFEPVDMQNVVPYVDGARITYPNSYEGVDIRYINVAGAVKEELVFHNVPTQPQFSFILTLSGVTPHILPNGSIDLTPCAAACWSILPPFLEDAQGATSDNVTVQLAPIGNDQYRLTYIPDKTWLMAPERSYPVVLDPTVDTRGTGDTLYIQQGYPTIAGYKQRYLSLGFDPENNGKGITRAFFYAPLPAIPAGSTIDSASLNMYQYYANFTNGYDTVVYGVASPWYQNPVAYTWNNPPAIDNTVIARGTISENLGWKSWDVTSLIRQWQSGTPNNGVAVYASPESTRGAYFCSSHASGPMCGVAEAMDVRPYFLVNFSPSSSTVFGNGEDGDFLGGDPNTVRTALAGNTSASQQTIAVANTTGFTVNSEILIIQMQGSGAGTYEFATLTSVGTGQLTLSSPLQHAYTQGILDRAQVLRVPHFRAVTGSISTTEWDGTTGGIAVFRALTISGAIIDMSARGFKGGIGKDSIDLTCPARQAQQGHSPAGPGGCSQVEHSGGGGGGDVGATPPHFGAGGGGGYGSTGVPGAGSYNGAGGNPYGSADLSQIFLGAGGGGGAWGTNPYGGGRNSIQGRESSGQGGGIAFIFGRTISDVSIFADGASGGDSTGGFGGYGGGGGAGGSIKLTGETITLDTLQAVGGAGGNGFLGNGGTGGVGRIRIEGCGTLPSNTTPPASISNTSCIQAPPRLDSISIDSAVANAGNVPVILTGANFQAPMTARIGTVDLLDVVVKSPTTAYAVIPVGSFAQGLYDVSISTGGTTATLPGSFTVKSPLPETQFRVMVYLSCDEKNIEADCRKLFNELEKAMTSNPNLRIVAFWDGYHQGDSGYYLIQADDDPYDWASYKSGENYKPLGEVDTADPRTLVNFAGWAQSQYPGVYKMLSLVGHGGGWAPETHPAQPQSIRHQAVDEVGGMLWDFSSGNTLATKPLAGALEWLNSKAYTIDILYLDACLMGSIEVATELSRTSNYIIAHENLTWSFFPYATYLRNVNAKTTPRDLAVHIAQSSQAAIPQGTYPAQVGVINTSRIPTLEGAVSNLGTHLMRALPTSRILIGELAQEAARVNDVKSEEFIIDIHDQAMDLYNFSTLLATQSGLPQDVRNAAQQVVDAFDNSTAPEMQVMVVNYTKNGYPKDANDVLASQLWDMQKLHGLSIYFPLNDDWRRRHYGEGSLERFGKGAWDDFIQAWFDYKEAPSFPIEKCDDCPFASRHIRVNIGVPPTVERGKLVYAAIKVAGVTTSDDLRGGQLTVISDSPTVVAPALDQPYRIGKFFPTNTYSQTIAMENGWSIIANMNTNRGTPPSGSGTIVSVPFYALRDGCVQLRIVDQQFVNGAIPAQRIPHLAGTQQICVGESRPSANASGNVYLEGRRSDQFGGVMITFKSGNGPLYSTMSQDDGSYAITQIPPGSYTATFIHRLYLATKQELLIKSEAGTPIPAVGLWGGDFNQSGHISLTDWLICAANVRTANLTYDLDANGQMDVADCAIVAKNTGRTDNAKGSPPLPTSLANYSNTSPSMSQSLSPQEGSLHLIRQDSNHLLLRTSDLHLPIYAVGVRLELPEGASILQAKGSNAFSAGEARIDENTSAVYLTLTLDDQSTGTLDSDIAQLELFMPSNKSLEDVKITTFGFVTKDQLPDSKWSVLLPLVSR